MREMTAPEGAVTVSKDRPNKEFIGLSAERSTADPRGRLRAGTPVVKSAALAPPSQ